MNLFTVFFCLTSLLLSSASYSHNRIVYTDPQPDSKFVKTENTVVVGYDNPITLSLQEIAGHMSISGNKHGRYSGTVILTEENRKIVFKPTRNFELDEEISVSLTGPLSGESDHNEERTYSFETAVKKIPWNPLNSIISELKDTSDIKRPEILDAGVPPINITIDHNPAGGNIFLSNIFNSQYSTYLIITSKDGISVYAKPMINTCYDFKKQPNGNLTYYAASNANFFELSSNYDKIDSFSCGNGYTTDLHELRLLPNRHALLMSYDPEYVDMSVIVPGGNPNAIVIGLIVQELDDNKNVVFQWRSWDHFQITDAWHENMQAANIDCVHGNAIEADNDGNLMISSRHLDEITKINRTNGEIIWRFGGKNNQFTFTGDTLKFTYQHAIRRIANGNVTLYDNGNFHTPHFSRAVEYSLDEANKVATAVWQYKNTPAIYGLAMGYVQELDNGNTLIAWGFTNPTATEVTPDGTIALEMSLPPQTYSYRVYKEDWNGPLNGNQNSGNSIPKTFAIRQNFPNPFNPSTTISFDVPQRGNVKIVICDILGSEVKTIVNDNKEAGSYKVNFDASSLASGVYFHRMTSGSFIETRKMVLIK